MTKQHRAAILVAVASAALVAAPSGIATPLTGESVSGSGTASTSGQCTLPTIHGSGTFSVSGMATGPYPGTFRESGGYSYSSVAGKQPYYLHFSASFTITSGGATITGSLVFRYPGAWVVVGCPGAMFSNLPVNYTTVVGGQTYQGTAKVGVSAKAEAAVSQSFTG